MPQAFMSTCAHMYVHTQLKKERRKNAKFFGKVNTFTPLPKKPLEDNFKGIILNNKGNGRKARLMGYLS